MCLGCSVPLGGAAFSQATKCWKAAVRQRANQPGAVARHDVAGPNPKPATNQPASLPTHRPRSQGLLLAPLVRTALALHPGVLFTAFAGTAGEACPGGGRGVLRRAMPPCHADDRWQRARHAASSSARLPLNSWSPSPPSFPQASLLASRPPPCCPPAASTSTLEASCPRCVGGDARLIGCRLLGRAGASHPPAGCQRAGRRRRSTRRTARLPCPAASPDAAGTLSASRHVARRFSPPSSCSAWAPSSLAARRCSSRRSSTSAWPCLQVGMVLIFELFFRAAFIYGWIAEPS